MRAQHTLSRYSPLERYAKSTEKGIIVGKLGSVIAQICMKLMITSATPPHTSKLISQERRGVASEKYKAKHFHELFC